MATESTAYIVAEFGMVARVTTSLRSGEKCRLSGFGVCASPAKVSRSKKYAAHTLPTAIQTWNGFTHTNDFVVNMID